jgi:hypothetical protein
MALPDVEFLREILNYDPSTGLLTWKERDAQCFSYLKNPEGTAKTFNSQFAGREAFTALTHGYRCGAILNKLYYAHRIAWKIHYGKDPAGQIDHINHDRSDNRISNLREVSHQENHKNLPIRRTNLSGFPGVRWYEKPKRWRAYITNDGKTKYLGSFIDKNDAIRARVVAEKSLGFHENHGAPK